MTTVLGGGLSIEERAIKPSPTRSNNRLAKRDGKVLAVLDRISDRTATLNDRMDCLSQLCSLLEEKKLPDSVMPQIVDSLTACMTGKNFKICVLALQCVRHLVGHAMNQTVVKSFLPSIAEVVAGRWGDIKDEVCLLAVETALDMARWSTPLRYDFFLKQCAAKGGKARLNSLAFLGKLVHEFGVLLKESSNVKAVIECARMTEDRDPRVRSAAIETLVVAYGSIGESIWNRNVLGHVQLASSTLDALQKSFAKIAPPHSLGTGEESTITDQQEKNRRLGSAPKSTKKSARKGRPSGGLSSRPVNRETPLPAKSKRPSVGGSGIARVSGGDTALLRDEENAVADASVVRVASQTQLVEEVTKIEALLKTKSTDWKRRNAAMERLRGIMTGGIAHIDCYEHQIKRLLEPLHVQIKELRSGVVRQACLTVATMSKVMKNRFENFAEQYTPDLLTLTANRIGIMSKSADYCLRAIIASSSTGLPKVLVKIIDGTAAKVDKLTRARAQEYLLIALKGWVTKILEKHVSILEQAVERALEDRSDGVRQTARLSFWAFEVHFPDRAMKLLRRLSSVNQERLYKVQDHRGTQSAPVSPVPTSPISTDMKKATTKCFHVGSPPMIDRSNEAGTTECPDIDVFQQPVVRVLASRQSNHEESNRALAVEKIPNTKRNDGSEGNKKSTFQERPESTQQKKKLTKRPTSTFERFAKQALETPKHVSVDSGTTMSSQSTAGNRSIFEKYALSGRAHLFDDARNRKRGEHRADLTALKNSEEKADKELCSTANGSENGESFVNDTPSSVGGSKKMSIFERYAASGGEAMETPSFQASQSKRPSRRSNEVSASYRKKHLTQRRQQGEKAALRSTGATSSGRPSHTPAGPVEDSAHPSMSRAVQQVETLIAGLADTVWSKRLRTLLDLKERLFQGDRTFIRCVVQMTGKLCRGLEPHLPDSHHKVTSAAMNVLVAMLDASDIGLAMIEHLDVLLPALFITLGEKKDQLRKGANTLLDTFRDRVEADQLARVLCNVADHRSRKARVGCQEFLLHIIPSAMQTFNSSTSMRLAVRKTCDNLKETNTELYKVSCLVLHALYKVNQAAFLSQVCCLESIRRAQIIAALKDYVSDLSERLKDFVRKKRPENDGSGSDISAPPCPQQGGADERVDVEPPPPPQAGLLSNELGEVLTLPGLLNCSKSPHIHDRCSALAHIMQLAKANTDDGLWKRMHNQFLSISLGALRDVEMSVQLRGVETLRALLEKKTKHMVLMLDVVLFELLDCLKISAPEMRNALGQALELMVSVFPPVKLMKALLPLLSSSTGIVLQYALSLTSKNISRMSSGIVLEALPEIMPPMMTAMQHSEACIRKEAVFGFVAVYMSVGESFMPYFNELSLAHRKLTTLYINRATQKLDA